MARLCRMLSRWLRIALIFLVTAFVLLTNLVGWATWYGNQLPPADKSAWFLNVKAASEYSDESAWRLDFDGHATVPLYLTERRSGP